MKQVLLYLTGALLVSVRHSLKDDREQIDTNSSSRTPCFKKVIHGQKLTITHYMIYHIISLCTFFKNYTLTGFALV